MGDVTWQGFGEVAFAAFLLGCDGSKSETTRLLHGCAVPEAGVADPCCQPCWGTLEEDCDESLREFPNQARTRREFEALCDSGEERLVVAAGQCSSGVRFLGMANGYISDTRYFEASGAFIALRRSTDFDPTCNGYRYFPEVVTCEVAVTEELCRHP